MESCIKNVISILVMLFFSVNAANAEVTNDDVAPLFGQWDKALQTGSPAAVTALYADNAVLLPTASNEVRSSHAQIEGLLCHFFKI